MSITHIDGLRKLFGNANIGRLTVYTPNDQEVSFSGPELGPEGDFKIYDWKVLDMIAKRGDIGLGEAYHMGLWDSSNTSNFLTYCCVNLSQIGGAGKANLYNKLAFYLYNHLVRLNTKYGSKSNILAHYDIGNDFYSLWLDPTMTYSSAIRNNNEDDLEQSQVNKYNRIINNLELADKNVLEIGCGWGGFAEQAAKVGAQLTGITISDRQHDFAKKRLGNSANILKQDYRDVNDTYDRVVSIEMFEAVGEKYWPAYFNQIKKSLVKGGRAIIQTITIDDEAFSQYRKGSDYIRHHVFPGGMLPSRTVFCHEARKANLDVGEIFDFANDYAWTLAQWQKKFSQHKEQLISMNFSETFLRAWDYYFSVSIASFKSGRTNVMQVELIN